ncbi:MAG: hypothetical protein HRU14_07040 [Planctomycetes bacterium]|nr:hypothetical protein [Planctomycetota bacterium]
MSIQALAIRPSVRVFSLCLMIGALALSAPAQITPARPLPHTVLMNTLNAHINTFASLNYSGTLTATTSIHEIVTTQSNKPVLASLIADNWHVIDPYGATFPAITGIGKANFIASELMPRLVTGALVARVDWDLSGTTMTDYALVTPGATVGDTDAIQEGVTGWFTVPTSYSADGGGCPSTFSESFKNGFGSVVANYNAYVACFNGNCVGSASANDAGPGCSAQAEYSVRCANNTCLLDYAFVGSCGFPSVSFDSSNFSFSVSGFGWSYFNASGTLCKTCNCGTTPVAQYQINQSSASLSIDGTIGSSIIAVTRPVGQAVTWVFDSDLMGNPWQVGVMDGNALTTLTGGNVTGEGQVVSLSLASTAWAYPWPGPAFTGQTTFVHTPHAPMTVTAQMIVMDPIRPDGFALSAPGTLMAQ